MWEVAVRSVAAIMREHRTYTTRQPVGTIGRIARWSVLHRRAVVPGWAVLILALGVPAPRAEHALSGGGRQADDSESVEAGNLVEGTSAARAATRSPSW
jgi:hypothetical protein